MTQDTHDTPERPRPLTDAEVNALRREMKESTVWAQAELCRRDHTSNALTAETMRKSEAGVDVVKVDSIEVLFKHLKT